MGPVSFDRISIGADRELAMAAAGRIADAGIRVDLVSPGPSDSEYVLMVRASDYARAVDLAKAE